MLFLVMGLHAGTHVFEQHFFSYSMFFLSELYQRRVLKKMDLMRLMKNVPQYKLTDYYYITNRL